MLAVSAVMESLMRRMMDGAANDGDAWMHRCLSVAMLAPLLDAGGDVFHAAMDVVDACRDGILPSEPGMSSVRMPAPSDSCSRLGLQACFSPAGLPSASVTSGPSSECVMAPSADRFDGRGDD